MGDDVELWKLVGSRRQFLYPGDFGVGNTVCSSGELGFSRRLKMTPEKAKGAGVDYAKGLGQGKCKTACDARGRPVLGIASPSPLLLDRLGLPPASGSCFLRSTTPALSRVPGLGPSLLPGCPLVPGFPGRGAVRLLFVPDLSTLGLHGRISKCT